MKYSQLIQTVQLRPPLVRPQQAALILSSGELVSDFIAAGWLNPVVSRHRLVLYSYRDLERCVARLEDGESPRPNDRCKRPQAPDHVQHTSQPDADQNGFGGQLRRMVSIPPLLVRPEQAAAFLGSVELLDDLRQAGWIEPVYCKPRLTAYSVRHLEACVIRIEAGLMPGEDELEKPKMPPQAKIVTQIVSPVVTATNHSHPRVFRKTRRPMPVDAEG